MSNYCILGPGAGTAQWERSQHIGPGRVHCKGTSCAVLRHSVMSDSL